jgi:GR25 family glycosyltransferase involved in LPS biosynthesis
MKLPFDKIYCIHLVEAGYRHKSVLEECKKINLENEINFWYTSKKPINKTIGDGMCSLHDDYYNKYRKVNEYTYGACFDCAYNHYSIIKQAYIRGLNSILIIEDDIFFHDDIDLLNDVIDNIPEDYDILKFYNQRYQKDNEHIKDYFISMDINNYQYYYHSTLCYALSRNGMKSLIDEYESNFAVADIALNNIRLNKDIKFYTLKSNLICSPKRFVSTIIGRRLKKKK